MTHRPVLFFVLSFAIAAIFWFAAAFVSYGTDNLHLLLPLILAGLSAPTLAALIMFGSAKDRAVWRDFAARLNPFRIKLRYLPLVLGFVPCVLLLAVLLSLFFGASWEQFSVLQLADKALEGQSALGLVLVTALLCTLEELGWRGYGIDSLRGRFSFAKTSAIFGILWFLWHIPAFFIRNGYFHDEIWNRELLYVATYALTLFSVTFFINWMHVRNERSIIAPILIHASMNISVAFFPIEPPTRIIFMILMAATALILIRRNAMNQKNDETGQEYPKGLACQNG